MALSKDQMDKYVKLGQLQTFKTQQDTANAAKFAKKGDTETDLNDLKNRTLKNAAAVTGTRCTATFTPSIDKTGASLNVAVPMATTKAPGLVYAEVAADINTEEVYGFVKTAAADKGSGLYVTGLNDGMIAKSKLANALQDEINAKATTNALNTVKTEAAAATKKVADDLTAHKSAADAKYATKQDVTDGLNRLTSAIIPKGSLAFDNLPTPAAANLGFMYNVTNAFTTTDAFLEGAGKTLPAGTNVVVVDAGNGAYKWDMFAGMVDTSAFVTAVTGEANVVNAKRTGSSVAVSIADSGIGTAKIADSAVASAKIAASAVTTAKIADVNVTTAKLADKAVTDAKINNMNAAKLTGTVADTRLSTNAQAVLTKVNAMTDATDADINAMFA